MNFLNQIIDLYKIIKLKKLKIDESTTKEKIVEYLNSIPNKYQLSFFDYFHPQISDPGAFVIAQKNNEKYIDELDDYTKLQNKKIVAIDPGKCDILYCVDGYNKDATTFRYTQDSRRKETKSVI